MFDVDFLTMTSVLVYGPQEDLALTPLADFQKTSSDMLSRARMRK